MTTPPHPPPPSQVLRVSLTDRCDLRCRYCMPAQGVPFTPHGQLPTLEELADAVAFTVRHLGVRRVKLTGGEPLVRRGAVAFVAMVAAIEGVEEVSMTSNGTHLARLARQLKAVGLARVNVSLDTLHPGRFAELTRGGDVRRVLAGIGAAQKWGLTPVKLNAVLRASSYREDVPELLAFATRERLELRFIELMRTGTEGAWCQREYVSARSVQHFLASLGELTPLPSPVASPARPMRLRWAEGEVRLGFITPVSESFCDACNRLRLDAQGRLRRCLMDTLSLPLVQYLKAGDDAARRAVVPYLEAKAPPAAMVSASPMVAVGG